MSGFWERYKKRELTLNDALGDKIWWRIFFPFVLLSMLALYSIDAEETSEMTRYSFFCFFPFLFVIHLSIFCRCLPKQPTWLISVGRWLGAFVFASFFSLMGIGYIELANALTGPSELIFVSGPVIKMERIGGRWAGKIREVTIPFDGREIRLRLTEDEYSVAQLGQPYGRWMKKGGLGYYYNWGLAYWK